MLQQARKIGVVYTNSLVFKKEGEYFSTPNSLYRSLTGGVKFQAVWLSRWMYTRACKGDLKAPACSKITFFVCLTGAWVQCFTPLKKAHRSPYRQLTCHLTCSLTGVLIGHKLVGTNLWQPHNLMIQEPRDLGLAPTALWRAPPSPHCN